MEQRIELIGVDSHEGRNESDQVQLSGGTRTATVQREGFGGTGRAAVALVVLVALFLLMLSTGDTSEEAQDGVAPVETPDATAVTTPAVAATGLTLPRIQPIVAAASGITLVVGRGIEKTFIDLDTGNKMVVDVEGAPVAGTSGYLALAVGRNDAGRERCWFSLAERACVEDPTRLTGGSSADAPLVHVFDPLEVRALTATTHDGRWLAEWRYGQLIVTEQSTGEVSVVPGIQRSYFDDAMALIG